MSDYYRNLDAAAGIALATPPVIHLAFPASDLVGVELTPLFDEAGQYQPLIPCRYCERLSRHKRIFGNRYGCTRCKNSRFYGR